GVHRVFSFTTITVLRFLSRHQGRIAHVDDLVSRNIGLQQILRLVPGDLVDDALLVDAALGFDISDRLRNDGRRRTGEFRHDIEDRGRIGAVAVLAVGSDEGVGEIMRAVAIGDEEALDQIRILIRVFGRGEDRVADRYGRDIAGPGQEMELAAPYRTGDRHTRHDRRIDRAAGDGGEAVAGRLQWLHRDIVHGEAIMPRRFADGVMERGADLADRDRMAFEVGDGFKPRIPRLVRRDKGKVEIARRIAARGGDQLELALCGEGEEGGGHPDGAEIDIARSDRDRGRLGGIEEHHLDIDPLLLEITARDADRYTGESDLFRETDLYMVFRVRARKVAKPGDAERRGGNERQDNLLHESSHVLSSPRAGEGRFVWR